MTISWIQIGFAAAYIVLIVAVGLFMSRKVKNSEDYWIGGRQIGPMATAISYCAAYYSTVAIVGAPPMYYLYGMGYLGLEAFLNILLTGIVIFIVFAPRMRAISERVNAVSLSGFLAVRYSSNKIRLIGAVVIAVMMIPYAISCVKGIGDVMQSIAGVPYKVSVIVIIVVTFAYLITSGYWGTSTVDIIQGITISLALIVTAAAILYHAGGLTPIFDYLTQELPETHTTMPGELSWGTLFSYAGVWAFIAFGQPQLTTKFMGLKDSRTVGAVIRISVVWMIIYYVCAGIIGLGALYLYDNAAWENIDLISPSAALDFGGNIAAAIFLCGALAAGFSTVAALILTSSSAVAKDIYEDYRSNVSGAKIDSRNSVKVSRVVTGVVLLLVGLGSLYPLDFVWSLSTMSAGVVGAAFTAPIILGLYWKRATKEGCYAGIIGGSILSIIWYAAGLSDILHSFVPGTLLSFALMVIVSLCTKPMEKSHLDVFFEAGCSEEKIEKAIASGRN